MAQQKKIRHEQVDAGQNPNQLVKLQADGKLPPLDGSNLTNVPGTGELVNDTSPQLGGNLDLNSFNIFTTAVGSPATVHADDFIFNGGNNYSAAGAYTAGGFIVNAGAGYAGNEGGQIDLNAGNSTGGTGGYVSMVAGNGNVGGNFTIAAGTGSAGDGGDITISSGTGSGIDGTVSITGNAVNIYDSANAEATVRIWSETGTDAYIGLQAPNTAVDRTWTLPDDDPAALGGGSPHGSYFLTTNAAGELSFAFASAGGASALNDLTDVTITNIGSPASIIGQILHHDGSNWVNGSSIAGPLTATYSRADGTLKGVTGSSATGAAGVVGQSIAGSGSSHGVIGTTASLNGIGGQFSNTYGGSERRIQLGSFNSLITGSYSGIKFNVTKQGVVTAVGGIDNLTTTTGVVDVSGAAAPTTGQVLTATSSTTATWQDPTGASTLNELTDVSTGGSPEGQVLKYVNGVWTNAEDSGLFTEDAQNNIIGGTGAGTSLASTAYHNFIAGINSGNSISLGDKNIIIGNEAGKNIVGRPNNIVVGYGAMSRSDSANAGQSNVAIGTNAFRASKGTTSSYNVFIGTSAAQKDSIAGGTAIQRAVGVGSYALFNLEGGIENTVVGSKGAFNLTTGEKNTTVGYGALGTLTTGSYNTAIGWKAGFTLASSSYGNVLLGNNAGPVSGVHNNELYINNAQSNTPLIHGSFAPAGSPIAGDITINGSLTVTGILNTSSISLSLDNLSDVNVAGSPAVTGQVLTYNGTSWVNQIPEAGGGFTQSGSTDYNLYGGEGGTGGNLASGGRFNFLAGYSAGPQLTTGDRNVLIGYQTGNQSTTQTAVNNVVVGPFSGQGLTSGNQNIFIGTQVGNNITTGADNIVIGRHGPTSNVSRKLWINNNISSSDPPLIEGDFDTDELIINGDLTVTGSFFGNQTLNSLDDVTVAGSPLVDGQVLTYSRTGSPTTGFWTNKPAAGGASTLNELTDVTLGSPVTGQVLTYDGANWTNQAGGGKPQYEQIIVTNIGSPATEADHVINTTVPTVGIAGSPLLASLQVFRNGILQDEDLDAGSPATITEDYKVTGPNQITFADGLLTVGDKIKIFAFV